VSARSTQDGELAQLRRALARVERGRGRRYPASLRERVARWAGARRRSGAKWGELSDELRISAETLRQWLALAASNEAGLVPVEVVAEAAAGDPASGALRLVTRVGHRIEGLSIADVIELVRVLG